MPEEDVTMETIETILIDIVAGYAVLAGILLIVLWLDRHLRFPRCRR